MITVTRKEKESSDRLILRFNKKVQQSRILLKVRKGKFFQKDKTRRQVREGALVREMYRAKLEKMKYY